MKSLILKSVAVVTAVIASTSCMTTYDAYGRPVQSVDPAAATAAADASAGDMEDNADAADAAADAADAAEQAAQAAENSADSVGADTDSDMDPDATN